MLLAELYYKVVLLSYTNTADTVMQCLVGGWWKNSIYVAGLLQSCLGMG